MKHFVWVLAGAVGLLSIAAVPTSAQQKPAAPPAAGAAAVGAQPGATTATYQDWILRCVVQEEAGRVCEIAQNLQV